MIWEKLEALFYSGMPMFVSECIGNNKVSSEDPFSTGGLQPDLYNPFKYDECFTLVEIPNGGEDYEPFFGRDRLDPFSDWRSRNRSNIDIFNGFIFGLKNDYVKGQLFFVIEYGENESGYPRITKYTNNIDNALHFAKELGFINKEVNYGIDEL